MCSMVFRIMHNRKPVPPRDPVCDPITGAVSMEQIVRAYMTGQKVDLPEPVEGDYEFPATDLGDNERYRDISSAELRSDDITPISIPAVDAAVINTDDFSAPQDTQHQRQV